jgi:hypothetical protein
MFSANGDGCIIQKYEKSPLLYSRGLVLDLWPLGLSDAARDVAP